MRTEESDALCLDCGLDYSEFGMDLLLPRHQWIDIHPSDGGLLCALCIVRRAAKLKGAVAMQGVIAIAPSLPPALCVCPSCEHAAYVGLPCLQCGKSSAIVR